MSSAAGYRIQCGKEAVGITLLVTNMNFEAEEKSRCSHGTINDIIVLKVAIRSSHLDAIRMTGSRIQ